MQQYNDQRKYKSDIEPTLDNPYLALPDELCDVCTLYLKINKPRYNGTALYLCLTETVAHQCGWV